jgi:lyso-ornithine lipid O-acyltransferase
MIFAVRILLVFLMFVILTVPLFPLQVIATRLQRFWFKSLPHFWHKRICWLLGVKIEVEGTISNERPLLLISNHVSWTDILVLGSLEHVSFIAKDEVRDWPMFGTFAKLQRTIFIDRNSKRKAGSQSRDIADRLKAGDILVLFPEGTTSDGNRVLPFKSSLFGAAKMALDNDVAQVFVQPVSIAYTKSHGIPLGRYHRSIVGWSGTVSLVKHLTGLIKARSITVEVTFGAPMIFNHETNRKQLAKATETAVKTMNERSLRMQANLPSQIASNVEAKSLNGQA